MSEHTTEMRLEGCLWLHDARLLVVLGHSSTYCSLETNLATEDLIKQEILKRYNSYPDLLAALEAIIALDCGEPDIWNFDLEFEAGKSAIEKARGNR